MALDLLKATPIANGPIPTGCADLEVLIARGTGEGGPYGAIVGDPLMKRLNKELGSKVQGYAVQYPASSNITGMRTGAADVIKRLTSQITACPKQRFALVGYSQGSGVMAYAAPKIPAEVQEKKIIALLGFGDPSQRNESSYTPELRKKMYENCEACDMVCDKGKDFGPHLHYQEAKFQDKSVEFIIKALQGTPLPPKASVPEIKAGECSGKSPAVTITINCPKAGATTAPAAKGPSVV